jgi:hypothetical protein
MLRSRRRPIRVPRDLPRRYAPRPNPGHTGRRTAENAYSEVLGSNAHLRLGTPLLTRVSTVAGGLTKPPTAGTAVARVVTVAALACLVPACHSPPDTVLEGRLEDGRVLRELMAPDRPTALLIYDASTCFSCGTPIPNWEAMERDGKIRLVLVLTGSPTDADQRVLRIRRIPVTAILKDHPQSLIVPSEYVVEGGAIRAAAEGRRQIDSLRLWTRSPIGSSVRPRSR